MALILVGTRFQAVMALSIVRHQEIKTYDLVIFSGQPLSDICEDIAFRLLAEKAASVTIIDRTMNPVRFLLSLILIALKQSPGDRTIYTAAIAIPQMMAVFRLCPFLRCMTFDEGGYNISTDSPYRRPERQSRLRSILFPGGVIAYAGMRSCTHFTAFEPAANLFPEKAVQIRVNWEDLLVEEDLNRLPDTVGSIFVLPCLRDLGLSEAQQTAVLSKARSHDIAICHPREKDQLLENAFSLSSPVEAIIAHFAKRNSVKVSHYRSTIGHTMAHWPEVEICDQSIDRQFGD